MKQNLWIWRNQISASCQSVLPCDEVQFCFLRLSRIQLGQFPLHWQRSPLYEPWDVPLRFIFILVLNISFSSWIYKWILVPGSFYSWLFGFTKPKAMACINFQKVEPALQIVIQRPHFTDLEIFPLKSQNKNKKRKKKGWSTICSQLLLSRLPWCVHCAKIPR